MSLIEEYCTAKACEAVLCATFYGTANYRGFTLPYPYSWQKKLGISAYDSRRSSTFQFSPYIGCKLDLTRNIVIFNSPAEPKVPNPPLRLHSNAKLDMNKANEILNGDNGQVCEKYFGQLAGLVLKYIKIENMDIINPPRGKRIHLVSEYDAAAVLKVAKHCRIKTILSSGEIAGQLIYCKDSTVVDSNTLIGVLLDMIRYAFGRQLFKYGPVLMSVIEQEILKEGQELIILRCNKTCSIGLPWAFMNFTSLVPSVQEKVIAMYLYWASETTGLEPLDEEFLRYNLQFTQQNQVCIPMYKKDNTPNIICQLYRFKLFGIKPNFF